MSVLIAAAGLALAGCAGVQGPTGSLRAANDGGPPTLERPGTRITLRNPEPAKWAARPNNRQQGGAIGWVCRPLACANRAAVSIQLGPSPTRQPDRKALERIAKLLPAQVRAQDTMMEAVSDGDERITSLSSRVTEVRGYPAIKSEAKRTSRGKVSYMVRGDLFVGAALIKLVSLSTDRAEAKKHFDTFVEIMEVIDVEGAPAGAPPAAAGPVALEDTPAPPSGPHMEAGR